LLGGPGGANSGIEKAWSVADRTGSEAGAVGRALDVGTGGGLVNVDGAAAAGGAATTGGRADSFL